MFGISTAYAQTAAAAPSATDSLISLLPPIIIAFVIVYFMVLRPQQKRAKEHDSLISNVRRGDTIVTTGGIIGKVSRATDDLEVEVEISPNVKVRILRQMIAEVRAKGEPVKEPA